MDKIEFHSHEQQDEFIYNLFGKKQNGFFLDISCGHPIIGSNSYTLEKYCSWTGFGFDIGNCETLYQWSQKRTSPFIQADATSADLTDFLISNTPADRVYDYISLDVDANGTNLALQSLQRVLESGIKFKSMTFEHECYIHGPTVRDQAATLLEDRGYVPLFPDVRLWGGGIDDDSAATFEDWWIHPDYFDSSILSVAEPGLYYFDCVERIKKSLGNEYTATHNCSRGWPDEYKLFWHEQEQQQLASLFSQFSPRPKEDDESI